MTPGVRPNVIPALMASTGGTDSILLDGRSAITGRAYGQV